MLIGTSGVGKTELARAVAEVLFGDERFMAVSYTHLTLPTSDLV